MEKQSNNKGFNLSKYQVQPRSKKVTLKIPDTDDEIELTVKQMSWSKRNQLLSSCLKWEQNGKTDFNGDIYVRECLKEMIVDAPWGRTTEAFLLSIDERLGGALETLVPSAFTGEDKEKIDSVTVKKG